MSTWVLVPCPRSRLEELRNLLTSISADPQRTVIVTTLPDPIQAEDVDGLAQVLLFESDEMLFGEWINHGLDYIAARQTGFYEVACLSSDVLGIDTVALKILAGALRDHDLGMVGPDLNEHVMPADVLISRTVEGRDVFNRVHGSCFMVAGELQLRFDPQFRWWFSDDDFESQHRVTAGVGLVGGTGIMHRDNPPSAQAQEWAAEDLPKYIAKWGHAPW